MSVLADVLSLLILGVQRGAIYILLAVGLSIILGTLKFVNFAHGALYLIGAYLGLVVASGFAADGKLAEWGFTSLGLNAGYLAALVVVPLVVFAVGLLLERFVARPFYDRPDTDQILLTFGLAIVVQELFYVFVGSKSINFPIPAFAQGAVPVPGVSLPMWRVYIIAITAVLVLIVFALVELTDFGLTVRAGTVDEEMVRLLGIRISRPYIVVFGIGAALAGVAGVVGAPVRTVSPYVGMDVLVPAFVTVVIGGVGNIRGAVLAGLLLGLTEASLIIFGFSQWAQVGIYALAALVLLVRPEGILGEEVATA